MCYSSKEKKKKELVASEWIEIPTIPSDDEEVALQMYTEAVPPQEEEEETPPLPHSIQIEEIFPEKKKTIGQTVDVFMGEMYQHAKPVLNQYQMVMDEIASGLSLPNPYNISNPHCPTDLEIEDLEKRASAMFDEFSKEMNMSQLLHQPRGENLIKDETNISPRPSSPTQ